MARLQQELHKRQPFESPEQEAVLNLFRTSDRLHHRFAQFFAEHGLTSSQYNILRILRGEGRPLQCMEIAQRTITVVPGITGLIDRLEQKKPALVKRERSRDDRRVVYVSITRAGEEILARIGEPLAELHRQVLADFSADEILAMIRLMEKARQNCSGDPAGPQEP